MDKTRAACSRGRSRAHDEKAQGLIEFAIIAMILMWLFLGTLDFARFLYFDTEISSAARQGAMTASSHCVPTCSTEQITTRDYVMQSVVCEVNASAILKTPVLKPQPTTCELSSSTSPYSSDPCSPCNQDVFVSPSYAPGSNPLPNGPGFPLNVTVVVGYDFEPITPLIGGFFPHVQCFPGGVTENTHTLCATATGRISA